MPDLTVKELGMILFQLFTLAMFFAGLVYKIRQLEIDNKRLNRTLYHEQGGLNVISCAQCKIYRDDVFTAIRKGDSKVDEQTKELRILNERVLKIMIHLKIDNQNNIV